jgi:hypothetical protein
MKGFKYQYSVNNDPLTLTIFSAPRYCDTYQNKGAIAIIKVKEYLFRTMFLKQKVLKMLNIHSF